LVLQILKGVILRYQPKHLVTISPTSQHYLRPCIIILSTGFGVDQLIDGSLDTYWQSDGPQPHLINIQFRRKTTITDICLYADYKADESYTPSRQVLFLLDRPA